MTGFVLDMFFKPEPEPEPEPKLPPKPDLPPVPVRLLDRSMALETKSMNERKRRPTYLPGRWIHKLCGLKRNIVLVNKTDHHVKFTIKKIPSCKCFMSTCKILLPSGAGIEGQFENQENQEIQEILLGPMTDEYIDHCVYLLPSKNVLVTLEMDGKMIFKNRKMGSYDKYTCRNYLFSRVI